MFFMLFKFSSSNSNSIKKLIQFYHAFFILKNANIVNYFFMSNYFEMLKNTFYYF